MDLNSVQHEIKDLINLNLIDVTTPINTKGSYIHLKSLKELKPLTYSFTYVLTFVSYSLQGEKDSSLELLNVAINDLKNAKLNKNVDFDLEAKLISIEDLIAYELTINFIKDFYE